MFSVCAAAFLSGIVAADDQARTKAGADADFVAKAAAGGMAEVQLAKIAVERAQNPRVKEFAERMLRDHGTVNRELTTILTKKNQPMPTELTRDHQSVIDKLSQLNGAEFDKAYMTHMHASHTKGIELFEGEAKNGQDVDLKAFAMKTLPTIKEHLRMAHDLKGGN
jgi:putative membrane protein